MVWLGLVGLYQKIKAGKKKRHPVVRGAIALLRLVAIALFVTIAIAIALAAVIIALFDAHLCAPSPPTAIHIRSDGGVSGSLAPAAADWRQQRQ